VLKLDFVRALCRGRLIGTGVRGDPKKEGAGGKGTWGSSMENSGPAAIDSKDPNYDSDADKAEPQKS